MIFINPWAYYDWEDIPSLGSIEASSEFKKMKFGKAIKFALITLCIVSGLSTLFSIVLFESKWWFGIICSAMACIFIGSLVAIIHPPFGPQAKEDWKNGCSVHPVVYIFTIPLLFGTITIIAGISKDPMINWVTISGIIITTCAIITFIVTENIQHKKRKSNKSKKNKFRDY